MQNSELYRRGIVLALDEAAEDCLRSNDVNETTCVRLVEIPSDELFLDLWKLDLFDEINRRCQTTIGDYEQEIVENSSVEQVLVAIDAVVPNVDACRWKVLDFLAKLRTLVQESMELSRPILFVL